MAQSSMTSDTENDTCQKQILRPENKVQWRSKGSEITFR